MENQDSNTKVRRSEDPLNYLRVSGVQEFCAGTRIFEAGEAASQVYLIMSGHVRITRSNSGREIVTSFYGPDSIFGESALIEGIRSEGAVAIENTRVMVWSPEQLEEAGKANPLLMYSLAQTFVRREIELRDRIESLASEDVHDRLVRALLELSTTKCSDQSVTEVSVPPIAHSVLASYIGTAREVVTQLMNKLRRDGGITYSRKEMRIYREKLLPHVAWNTQGGPKPEKGRYKQAAA